jgi:hypothetical protein
MRLAPPDTSGTHSLIIAHQWICDTAPDEMHTTTSGRPQTETVPWWQDQELWLRVSSRSGAH